MNPGILKGTLTAAALLLSASAAAQVISVHIYRTYGSSTGGGAPYSDLAGSFTAPGVTFATDTGYDWHPFGLPAFGALITGCLEVEKDGDYVFTLDSDDGSLLYIDGLLAVDNGGAHPPATASATVSLLGGSHEFRIEFYEDFGGPSGVDLILPGGVTYGTCIPEPATYAVLTGLGLAAFAGYRRLRGI